MAGSVREADRKGLGVGVEVEGVGSPPNDAAPILAKGLAVLVQLPGAPRRAQVHPIVDREGHRPQQLDTAEDERLVVRAHYVDLACRWTDRCCGAAAVVL